MELSCIRCGDAATPVVIRVGSLESVLDLCERHLADILRGSRRMTDPVSIPALPSLIGQGANTRPRTARGREHERVAP